MATKNEKKVKKATNYLPYNADAEKAVLGSALLSKDALYNVLSSLEEIDFYVGKHQIIYRALRNLLDKKVEVDVLTLTEELINIKELENVGGVNYLQECVDSMVALSSLEFYITIVSNQSTLRSMLLACREIDKEYLEGELTDVDDFIVKSEAKFKTAIERRKISSFKPTSEIATLVKYEIDNMKAIGDDEVIGLNTGYRKINYYTQGWRKGDMIVIAARPSVGKTALALNFAWNAAVSYHTPVGIFSIEMPAEQLVKRLISAASVVSLKKITTGTITGQDRNKVANAVREVAEAPIYIDDTPGNKLMDIIAKARKLQANVPNLGLIVIDYLGLVETGSKGKTSTSGDSRQEEVRKISLALKGLARELNVPVIVISQLSRDVEKRESKKPMMSDLRDSGSIEQDADVIMLLYREDYYSDGEKKSYEGKKGGKLTQNQKFELVKDMKEKELGAQMPGSASYVEVNIAKNRNGQTGRVGLFFFKEYGKFDSPSEEWEEAMLKVSESPVD